MKLSLVNPDSLGTPKGYSHGVLVSGDCDLLFVAGQIGWDGKQRLVSARLARQFDRALANVLDVVVAGKGLPEHIVRMTIYVADKAEYLAQLKELGEIYRTRMGRHYPAMALVEVSALLETGAKVEIEATAAIPGLPRRNAAFTALRRRLERIERNTRAL